MRTTLFYSVILSFILYSLLLHNIPAFLYAAEDSGPLPRYQAKLKQLADECEKKQMPLEAEITRRYLWESPQPVILFPVLPKQKLPDLPDDAAEAQKTWFSQLKAIQSEAGTDLLAEARLLAKQGEGYRAWKTAAQALFADPDNPEIRDLFGQKEIDGFWRTEEEAKKIEAGETDHPDFGWIPADSVSRYEAGERQVRGKWISPQKTARSSQKQISFLVESEHFRIESALSLEETVRLSRLLEEFHQFWYFHFYSMMLTEKEAAAFVLGKPVPKEKPHKIRIFRNRDDYLKAATKLDAGAVVSSGGYLPPVESIYAYNPENPDDTPLPVMIIHEAVHQLFAESPAVRKVTKQRKVLYAGLESNYWILEGIAVYLETFQIRSGVMLAGGTVSSRFLRAKERADEPNGLMPLEMFTSLGKEAFQGNPNLPALYTEAAGLTHFLLHAENGRYREAFFGLLEAVYKNQETADSLSRLTGLSFEELDEQFYDYLRQTPFTE